jgi:predicted lipoprotein with Yx(FWY)xxD motif
MSNHRIPRIAAAAAAAGALAAGASLAATDAVAASPHGSGAAAVKLGSVTVAGSSSRLLVDASGQPVYLLTGDSMGKPLCTSAGCLGVWPAVTSSAKKPVLGPGISGKLTVWTHKGMHQLVLDGHPLYRFAEDSGSTAKGEGIKAGSSVWELVTARGAGVAKVAGASGSTSTSGSSDGSEYGSKTTTSGSGGW